MKGNQDFENELKDFGKCIFEPDTVGNGSLIGDKFLPVKFDQIRQLLIQDLELFSNELLKQENVPVLVDVIQSVNVRSDSSSKLPSVSSFEVLQTHGVSMNVF
jgi:hypothetical protein